MEKKTKKIAPWALGIIIVITLYMSATLAFVFFSFTKEVNLVQDDFYQTAAEYDQHKAQIQRGNSVLSNVTFSLDEANGQLEITRSDRNIEQVELILYRPESKRFDQNKALRFSPEQDLMTINLSDIRQGKWILKAQWKQDGLNYAKEESIWIR